MQLSIATVAARLARPVRRCLPAAILLLLAAPACAGGRLYFTDILYPTNSDGYIRSCRTDGTDVHTIAVTYSGVRGIAIDADAGKMYWTNVNEDMIRRANLDATDLEALITTGMSWPMSIAIYHGGGRILFGDSTSEYVAHANLDGWSPSLIRSTTFGSGIAVDEVNGHVYWTETIDSGHGLIMRMDVNTGASVATIVSQYGKPANLAIDPVNGKIYWTDYVEDVVRRANLNGSGVETLYDVGENLNPSGIALDLVEGKVYWGQEYAFHQAKIMRMDLDGSHPEDVASGFGIIVEMDFVPEPCEGDINGDSAVDVTDLLQLLGNWGLCP